MGRLGRRRVRSLLDSDRRGASTIRTRQGGDNSSGTVWRASAWSSGAHDATAVLSNSDFGGAPHVCARSCVRDCMNACVCDSDGSANRDAIAASSCDQLDGRPIWATDAARISINLEEVACECLSSLHSPLCGAATDRFRQACCPDAHLMDGICGAPYRCSGMSLVRAPCWQVRAELGGQGQAGVAPRVRGRAREGSRRLSNSSMPYSTYGSYSAAPSGRRGSREGPEVVERRAPAAEARSVGAKSV